MLAASWSGALPIIPFAGLEFLMLFLCMHYVSRATCRREVITIHRDRITVERGISGPEQCYSLSRPAAHLHVISPSKPFDLHQLFLVGDKSRVPIAALLNDEDREATRRELLEAGLMETCNRWWQGGTGVSAGGSHF